MSEERWLTGDRPQGLVWQLQGTSATRTKVGRRKLRLVACGCCRLIWDYLDDKHRTVIETAEQFSDGHASKDELSTTRDLIGETSGGLTAEFAGAQRLTASCLARGCADARPLEAAFAMTVYPMPLGGYRGPETEANSLICAVIRDVFGNPFRPVVFDKSLRSDAALSLARVMYESRDFTAMPILADALQEAGCESEEVLNHCRDPKGVHVRGCWVVDLVLGKG